MANDDVHVLGAATMRERITTNKNGTTRSRVTIEISGESVGIGLDPRAYGKPVAEAIAELYRERIMSITSMAAPATLKAREVAKRALAKGKSWAVKRYGGGRIGTLEPDQSDRLFNDSGRMAKSIVVGAREGDPNFTINVAANRLDQNTAGAAGVQKIWTRLVQLVPELADVSLLLSSIPVRKAVGQAVKDNVVRVADKGSAAVRQLVQARMQAARAVIGLVA